MFLPEMVQKGGTRRAGTGSEALLRVPCAAGGSCRHHSPRFMQAETEAQQGGGAARAQEGGRGWGYEFRSA